MKKIYFYDTSKKTKVEFVSLKPNIAKIYVCGPTVYDNSHLGHARSAIAFDLGVFLVVVGSTVLILVQLGQLSKNSHNITKKLKEKKDKN